MIVATPLKLLIIEDSEDDVELILHALRRGGFVPDHACVENSEALRAALAAGPWEMMICDHSLPRLDAFAALRIAREIDGDIPFIIVSGAIGEETAVEAMRAGANDYVMKDNLRRLAPAIERELRDAETRRQKRLTETALEENQLRLRHAQKLESLGLLTGGVAHDFNNLLTVVMGNLELLQPMVGDDEARGLIDHALKAAVSGADLTQRLLAFSRHQALKPKPTDINALIPDICELIRSAVGVNIHIHRSLGNELAMVLVDRGELQLLPVLRAMTSGPAAAFALTERVPGIGTLSVGAPADIVVFDPVTVKDRATKEQPKQFPVGIEYVIVNGQVVIDRGENTGALPGRALRRGRPST